MNKSPEEESLTLKSWLIDSESYLSDLSFSAYARFLSL